jgi:meiotic recombination protein SPO11
MQDGFDHDMLFTTDTTTVDQPLTSDGPQLCHPNKHSRVIAQVEAVFETVADALLNERANVVVSLNVQSSDDTKSKSTKGSKATFTFPGKTANDAWRFCR